SIGRDEAHTLHGLTLRRPRSGRLEGWATRTSPDAHPSRRSRCSLLRVRRDLGLLTRQLGQMYPVPLGFLKQPTACGITCLGSHRTALGAKIVNTIVARKTP